MELEIFQETDRAILKVKGTVDEIGAEKLKQKFREINLSSHRSIVMDFSEVDYIGSAGIGKLLLFYKDLSIKGGKLCIENLNDTVYELFMALKIDSLFALSRA